MSERVLATQVGAPDPEMRNSRIIEETDYDYDVIGQELMEKPVCYFNGTTFEAGSFVCSGDEMLRCENGAWVRTGSCDPVNP